MSKKIAGQLNSKKEAESVVSELMERGFPRENIVLRSSGSSQRMGDGSDSLVEVSADDDAHAKEAADILYKHNALYIEADGKRL